MNLRQKNKKLKRELEKAKADLAKYLPYAAREIARANVGDIVTIRAYAHAPGYMMLSEEQFKTQMVKRMIPELAKCITLKGYIARGDVPNADNVLATIRVVKPRE